MELIKFKLRIVRYVLIVVFLAGVNGCATINPDEEVFNDPDSDAVTIKIIDNNVNLEPEGTGIYHKVGKGETLWRIAKTYRVSINDVIRTNNIPDVAEIETDQLIFIPGADKVKEIIIEDDAKANEFIWPLDGKVIKYFNQPDGNRINRGINIKANPGDKVRASRSGRVVFADFLPGYGLSVILDHEDGYHSVYTHNAEILVKVGEYITKRTPVAQIGVEGQVAYAHFEIRYNATVENPMFYLP